MCLVVIAWQQHADYPLIVAGNRDEFHARPTQPAHWWQDQPNILGGRDLQAGGTWLGLSSSGRFATVTNYRDAQKSEAGHRSRGHLITDFLQGDATPIEAMRDIKLDAYAGFNLLTFDGETLGWCSNRGGEIRELEPGYYGLSNALLDSPWHKVRRSRLALQNLIEADNVNETQLLRLLDDRVKAPVNEIESDHLPFDKAHAISAPFIVMPDYGTRCSSVATLTSSGEWKFHERRFNAAGKVAGDSRFSISSQTQA